MSECGLSLRVGTIAEQETQPGPATQSFALMDKTQIQTSDTAARSEIPVLHFELLRLVHFKLGGSRLNTVHVSPSQSVGLQWTEGPSSSALRSVQLCPILHLRLQVIEHYQFWQLPRATGIWVLPPFTHTAPPQNIHIHIMPHSPLSYCLSPKTTRAGNERRNKSCQSEERTREMRISVGMLRTMGYFVPGFITGLCLI